VTLPRRRHTADAIVVLGGGLGADGTLPQVAKARVERAVEAYRSGVAPRIIMTGRCALTAEPGPVTEARAMTDAAVALGVPEDVVLLEEVARDTLGNAYFVRELYLEPCGWHSIRVVTSDFHLSRAAWCFRKILGPTYDYSFISAFSGLTPHELIQRALEECKISIFLNEWLEAVQEGDDHAVDRLMAHEHPGYAEAPTLTHDELARRMDEIARINRIAGTQRWLAGEST
jgi:uncharacterized SAM-binding protein YcdF (DUF218 family)